LARLATPLARRLEPRERLGDAVAVPSDPPRPPSDHEPDRTLGSGRFLRLIDRGGWELVSRTGTGGVVGVVAWTDADELVLVEQHRPAALGPVLELPAGLVEISDGAGRGGDPALEAAKRELLEETGFEAGRWRRLWQGFTSPGLTDERLTIFRADRLVRRSEGGGVEGESIRVRLLPAAELPQVLANGARNGVPFDLKVVLALADRVASGPLAAAAAEALP
jgi:ADP-ribose pyrophosphatase